MPEREPVQTSQPLTSEEQAFLDKWFPGEQLTPQQNSLALKQARALGEQ